jgi:hypothetical protein
MFGQQKSIDIQFIARDRMTFDHWPKPVLAAENRPEWYVQMHPYSSGKATVISTNVNGRSSLNPTLKRCMPVQDGLTAGYHIVLPSDLQVDLDGVTREAKVSWPEGPLPVMTSHGAAHAASYAIPEGFAPVHYRWNNAWMVKTPPGWSCLFQHPAWHDHLPFRSLPVIVDTDRQNVVVEFPFLLERAFTGRIAKGTPIIQVLPFKRHRTKPTYAWDKDGKFNAKYHSFFLALLNQYRNRIRQPKNYSVDEASEPKCPFAHDSAR